MSAFSIQHQFVDRILLLVMPAKYQPDFAYLRHVRTNRVHLFTVIQLVCFIGMWVVKTTKTTAIAFPLMVRTPFPEILWLELL